LAVADSSPEASVIGTSLLPDAALFPVDGIKGAGKEAEVWRGGIIISSATVGGPSSELSVTSTVGVVSAAVGCSSFVADGSPDAEDRVGAVAAAAASSSRAS
jgi:hypothetical protein